MDRDTRWCISLDRVRCLEVGDRGSAEVSRVRGRSYQGVNKGAIQESPRCKRVRGHRERSRGASAQTLLRCVARNRLRPFPFSAAISSPHSTLSPLKSQSQVMR